MKEVFDLIASRINDAYKEGYQAGYLAGSQVAKKSCVDEGSSENPNNWIPVSKRLPLDNKEVLVYLSDSPYIVWFEDGEWNTDDFVVDKDFEPIAWMPLPEPYEAESEEV